MAVDDVFVTTDSEASKEHPLRWTTLCSESSLLSTNTQVETNGELKPMTRPVYIVSFKNWTIMMLIAILNVWTNIKRRNFHVLINEHTAYRYRARHTQTHTHLPTCRTWVKLGPRSKFKLCTKHPIIFFSFRCRRQQCLKRRTLLHSLLSSVNIVIVQLFDLRCTTCMCSSLEYQYLYQAVVWHPSFYPPSLYRFVPVHPTPSMRH